MERFSQQYIQRLRKRVNALSAVVVILLMIAPSMAQAATTLLVNNESFQTIDAGDGSSNRELRFGSSSLWLQYSVSNSRFEISRSLQVGGTLTATGAVIAKSYLSGAALTVNGAASIYSTLTASGTIATKQNLTINSDADANDATLTFGNTSGSQTLKFLNTVQKFQFSKGISVVGNISGSSLTIDGNASITGALLVRGNIKGRSNISGSTLNIDGAANFYNVITSSGSITTKQNLTINGDADSNDAVLTFGNTSGNQNVTFGNTSQKFRFSRGVNVVGAISGSSLTVDGNASITGALLVKGNIKGKANISGSTLNVDGNVNLHGVNYNFSTTQGGSNTFLRNDGAGNLTWTSVSIGNSSGAIMTLHPEYEGATYFSSGSTIIGQLTSNFDSTNFQNYYRWTSSKGVLHDEWIAVRFRIPKNFVGWDSAAPIQFRYRTGVSSNANNYLNIKMLDSTNTAVTLTNGSLLSNTSWTKANILGPQSAGTFTAGSGATVYVKFATDNTGFADAGDLQLNIRTSTP